MSSPKPYGWREFATDLVSTAIFAAIFAAMVVACVGDP